MSKSKEIETYITSFPKEVSDRLIVLRNLVNEIVPDAAEEFSYAMVGYKLKGKPLVYFGAYKNHVGIYALPITHTAFAEMLKSYKGGKGSVQFPHNSALPLELIKSMILFRVNTIVSEVQ
jgi:uncharacterized protein YdhG (YjbR/CyaY superfamily)